MPLPLSCSSLPPDVVTSLSQLSDRLRTLKWLDGPRDKHRCMGFLAEYFRRLNQVRTGAYMRFASADGRGLFKPGEDGYQDCGSFGIKWIDDSWDDANGWKRHCHLRGNISALSRILDFVSETAQSSGRGQARHECWDNFGEIASHSVSVRSRPPVLSTNAARSSPECSGMRGDGGRIRNRKARRT